MGMVQATCSTCGAKIEAWIEPGESIVHKFTEVNGTHDVGRWIIQAAH